MIPHKARRITIAPAGEDIIMRTRLQILAAILLATPILGSPTQAQDTKLTVMVFQGIQNAPLHVARQNGYFAKRGLTIDLRIAPNSDELREGLAAGRYQIVHSGVDNAIALVEVAKEDAVVVMGGDSGVNRIIVQPDIKTYADLRGRTVIVDAATTAFSFLLYKTLEVNGLKRGDYEVKPFGASFRRRDEMIKNKEYAAAVLNPPFSIQAERAGLRDMGSATKAVGAYQSTAGYVMRAWGKSNSDTLVRYIQAYIEGLRWVLAPANKDGVIALLAKEMKLPADIVAAGFAIYSDPSDGLVPDARLSMDGFRNMLKLRAEITGSAPGAPEKYIDLGYYQQALKGL